MPDAYEIIKKRWPEVVLIVGLAAGMFMLWAQLKTIFLADMRGIEGRGQLPTMAAFFLGLGSMSCLIVLSMLYLGFLRTAYEGGDAACEPAHLVRIGRYFLWRTVRFLIALDLARSFAAALTAGVLAAAFLTTRKPEDVPVWIIFVSVTLAFALLAKFVVLVPGIMVGRDMMVLDSIRAIGEYSFLEQGVTVIVCSGIFAVGSGAASSIPLLETEGALMFFLAGCVGAIVTVALLITHLEAVRLAAPPLEETAPDEDADPIEA